MDLEVSSSILTNKLPCLLPVLIIISQKTPGQKRKMGICILEILEFQYCGH